MKYALLVALIVAVAAGIAYAEPKASMSGGGDFSASAVLWFSGTNVIAQVSGNLTINGEIAIGEDKSSFKAKGPLTGAADGDSSAMTGSGWATFIARGTLDTGEAITLRGAIELSADDLDLSSGAAGAGSLYIILTLPDQMLQLRGKATGTAGGGFVAPDDPNTMQLDGSGSFTFTVTTRVAAQKSETEDSDSSSEDLSWDPDDWSQDLHDQFIRMMQEEESE